MDNFDEGLGTVYERVIMNDIFRRFMDKYSIHSVLEVPVYGMCGLTGINSVEFAQKKSDLTLVDNNLERIEETQKLWDLMGLSERTKICYSPDFSRLPFDDNSFDLVWNFAALWHIKDVPSLIKEMLRTSSNLVFISIQNKAQVGYWLRKHVIDRELFTKVYEEWLDMDLIEDLLQKNGAQVVEKGVFDVPPFPDIAMPVNQLLSKVRFKKAIWAKEKKNYDQKRWNWNIMDYYCGKDPHFRKKIDKFRFIENSALPTGVKALWAHHRYILVQKTR